MEELKIQVQFWQHYGTLYAQLWQLYAGGTIGFLAFSFTDTYKASSRFARNSLVAVLGLFFYLISDWIYRANEMLHYILKSIVSLAKKEPMNTLEGLPIYLLNQDLLIFILGIFGSAVIVVLLYSINRKSNTALQSTRQRRARLS